MKRFFLFAFALCALLASAAHAAPPAVARSEFSVEDHLQNGGTVFFLADSQTPNKIVAVGTAHGHPRDALALAGEVRFLLGHSQQRVSAARRFFAPPGRSFHEAGADLTQDIAIFALETEPQKIHVLEADPRGTPEVGERVRILGVPANPPHDEDDYFGTVASATASRIEIDLDTTAKLEGWGGAPVIALRSKRVVGVLQAAVQKETSLRLAVTPIASVLARMKAPLDGGQGRLFAAFASEAELARAREIAKATPTQAKASELSLDDAKTPAEVAQKLQSKPPTTQLALEIETPSHEAILGDPNGAFLAGRAVASVGELTTFDIAVVIDTSGSTNEVTGVDINGNGIVGENRLGSLFGRAATDPGDTILAAEVAAARAFLQKLDPRTSRVALITFAGEAPDPSGRVPEPAYTLVGLTVDFKKIDTALDEILNDGPDGATWMSAGVDQAVIELGGLRGAISEPRPKSEKIIVFLTDGVPTLPVLGDDRENARTVFRAADRARRQGIKSIVFAIGPEALQQPVAAVELAKRTDGIFMPIRKPGDLVDVMAEVRLVTLREVVIHNQTTQADASIVAVNADGTWNALLPLRDGKNRVVVTAIAEDGTRATQELTLSYVPGAQGPYLSAELLVQRNRLLERRLIELRQANQKMEQEQNEQRRKELLLEVETERAQAESKAKQQREASDRKGKPHDP